jgi:hypothetical protein
MIPPAIAEGAREGIAAPLARESQANCGRNRLKKAATLGIGEFSAVKREPMLSFRC